MTTLEAAKCPPSESGKIGEWRQSHGLLVGVTAVHEVTDSSEDPWEDFPPGGCHASPEFRAAMEQPPTDPTPLDWTLQNRSGP